MLFYYLAPLQNDTIVTSYCKQLTFEDKREVYLSVLPVTKKEIRRGKSSISPRMKFGYAIFFISISVTPISKLYMLTL